MAESSQAYPGTPLTPSNQEGPTHAPPSLPEGWLAQWEGQSRKYYFVQRATGHSQWDVPTQPALSVPTPDPTPQQAMDPFQQPPATGENGAKVKSQDGAAEPYEADRGFLSDLAMNAVTGGKQKPQNQSGLGGLASSFLGGQGSHASGGSGGSGGLTGQLLGSLLGGGKPHNQQQSQQSGSHGIPSSGGPQQGGLMGFLGGHGSSGLNNSYGYTSSGSGSGSSGYTGQAPPATYKPPAQASSTSYGPTTGQYSPSSQTHSTPGQYGSSGQPQSIPGSYNPTNQAQSAHGQYNQSGQPQSQYGAGSHSAYDSVSPYGQPPLTTQASYGQQNSSHPPPPPQSHYGGASPTSSLHGQQGSTYPYPSQPQGAAEYGQYPPHNPQNQQYPPHTPQNQQYPSHPPAYTQPGQQGGYNSYAPPPPPMNSHPSQQGQTSNQFPPSELYGSFPAQQGQILGQSYGQPPSQQGGYGQQGGQYGGYGASPAPGWRP